MEHDEVFKNPRGTKLAILIFFLNTGSDGLNLISMDNLFQSEGPRDVIVFCLWAVLHKGGWRLDHANKYQTRK